MSKYLKFYSSDNFCEDRRDVNQVCGNGWAMIDMNHETGAKF